MMRGYAQELLTKRQKDHPLCAVPRKSSPWVTLEKCLRLNLISCVDIALAQSLLKLPTASNEAAAAIICHLSHSARQGHLCISVRDENIYPDPRQSWLLMSANKSSSTSDQEGAILLKVINQLILQACQQNFQHAAICRFHELYYFQKYWIYEEKLVEAFANLVLMPPSLSVDYELLLEEIAQYLQKGLLLDKQAAAIKIAAQHSLLLLTGGPGTGKTYTAGWLLRQIWRSLPLDCRSTFKVALAAPTGKAAANLQASLSKALATEAGFPELSATTLHGLLEIKIGQTAFEEHKKISADLVLIDECSMVDVRLMALLLSSIKPGARLILLGDQHQLPSIEAGGIFSDFIKFFEERHLPNLVELTTCVRAENQQLIDFASAIKTGHVQNVLMQCQYQKQQNIVQFEDCHEALVKEKLLNWSKRFFKIPAHLSPQDLLKAFNAFRILSPLRLGPLGVEAINLEIDRFLKADVVPIILLQNDYRLNLYNGETGILVRHQTSAYAFFPGNRVGLEIRKFPAVLLPRYELAYCLSVHKSQGSEFEHVLMLVPKGSENFGREVFYTAATRAKQRLTMWGEEKVIGKTLCQSSQRLSGIRHKLSLFL